MTEDPAAYRVEANERDRHGVPEKTLSQVQQTVMRFLAEEAGFAQVYSINRDGFPVGRTMGAPIAPDWSVELVQRGTHRRLGQLRRNPRVEVVWCGQPAPDSVNDRPHVFDFGLLVPRVVLLRGFAEFMSEEWTIDRYRAISERYRSRGAGRAPARDEQQIRRELVGIRVRPIQVRAEGFGVGAQSYTWQIAGDE